MIRVSLYSKRKKLEEKLQDIERKFEAESKILKENNENKRLDKTKKNFKIKREMLIEEIKLIDDEINGKQKAQQLKIQLSHAKLYSKVNDYLQYHSEYKPFIRVLIKYWDNEKQRRIPEDEFIELCRKEIKTDVEISDFLDLIDDENYEDNPFHYVTTYNRKSGLIETINNDKKILKLKLYP